MLNYKTELYKTALVHVIKELVHIQEMILNYDPKYENSN
jgi:hypothetical protein